MTGGGGGGGGGDSRHSGRSQTPRSPPWDEPVTNACSKAEGDFRRVCRVTMCGLCLHREDQHDSLRRKIRKANPTLQVERVTRSGSATPRRPHREVSDIPKLPFGGTTLTSPHVSPMRGSVCANCDLPRAVRHRCILVTSNMVAISLRRHPAIEPNALLIRRDRGPLVFRGTKHRRWLPHR